EGNSIRATCRITARDKETVMRLLDDIGVACDVYQGGAPKQIRLDLPYLQDHDDDRARRLADAGGGEPHPRR
ncbi:MAG TPA: hypothetical protein VIN63_03850, partial [Candidatus Limnocylindria bacterium]